MMKTILVLLLAAGVGFAAASVILTKRLSADYAARLAAQQAAWEAERAEMEAALAEARQQALRVAAPVSMPLLQPAGPARLSPKEILVHLESLRTSPGASSGRTLRQAVYWLEELAQAGPAALPDIREFLARYVDLDLDTSWAQGKGMRDRLPPEFSLPPSLRFGLFEVLRQIGGAEAEKILSETLGATGRGVEVAYLTRLLQEIAPDKYRDQALGVARSLLASTSPFTSTSPLDRNHRDYLYGVLSFYGDTGYTSEAQAQLVSADSQIDRSALRYLQQTLGAQAVPVVAQAYQNPLLATNASAKEPLARLALNFVGLDPQANAFYQTTINDPVLTQGHRKNLIEDLNQDGFPNTKQLTANDLPLIQSRIALIEELAPKAMDQVNAAAFKEAYKDLINMRAKIITQPTSGIRPAGQP